MSGPNWLIRCLPGLSVIAVCILAECALEVLRTLYLGFRYPTGLLPGRNPVIAQSLFTTYSVYIHLLALLFPVRLCWCVWRAATQIKESHAAYSKVRSHTKLDQELDEPVQPSRSWDKDESPPDHDYDFIHAIMIPSYKEDIDVVEDTLKMLASHQMAPRHYDVRTPSP